MAVWHPTINVVAHITISWWSVLKCRMLGYDIKKIIEAEIGKKIEVAKWN